MNCLYSLLDFLFKPTGALIPLMAVPIVAALLVQGARAPRTSRHIAWLGVSVGLAAAMFVPALSVYFFFYGVGQSSFYFLTVPFCLYSIWLGKRIVSAHRRHLRGQPVVTRGTRRLALGFGAAVALALLPWVFGQPYFMGGGLFYGEVRVPASVFDYLAFVVPILLTVAVEVRLLKRIERPSADRPDGSQPPDNA